MTHIRLRGFPRGQALLEILIAVGIMSFLIATVTALIVVTQRSLESARRRDAATNLGQEALLSLRTIASGDDAISQGYNYLYCPSSGICPGSGKGTIVPYHVALSGGKWTLISGAENVTLEGIQYIRQLTIENMCRTAAGAIGGPTGPGATGADTTCSVGGEIHDPDTLRITVTLTAPRAPTFSLTSYVTRNRNVTSVQTDWSGGAVTTGTVTAFDNTYDSMSPAGGITATTELKINGAVAGPSLISRVFDTQATNGIGFNNILWQGAVTAPAQVGFLFAVSQCANGKTNPPLCNDAGNWTYRNPVSCTPDFWEYKAPDTLINVNQVCSGSYEFWNKRYFRYRVRLCYDALCTSTSGNSPIVRSIAVNWSK